MLHGMHHRLHVPNSACKRRGQRCRDVICTHIGLTENDGHETDVPSKLQNKRIENAVFRCYF